MLFKIWTWLLEKVFHVSSETKQKEIESNTEYAVAYERINDINYTSIFSNKLANYTISDSNMNIIGENPRAELLNKIGQSMWKRAKKITSMVFGYGGVFLIPYVKGNKLYYNLIPQNRATIDKTEGDLITGATILAERKEITEGMGQVKTYIRWTNYRLEKQANESYNCIIEQKFSDETGQEIPAPSFWQNILLKQIITGVDRVLLGYIKSPINNRRANDKYGVPITYGCETTIFEIKETLKQIIREYELKEVFVGIDMTLFDKNGELPRNGLFKKMDFGTDGEKKFEIFDVPFRDYTTRLQELYKRLEHEVGTSYGILSEVDSNNATATEIKRSMYDTFTICDDMRNNIEKGMGDFFYSCNVLVNAYNLSPQGEYELDFDWSYSLLEDTQSEWEQKTWAYKNGIDKGVEVRQWLHPDETLEESQAIIDEIKKENPDIADLLGTKRSDNE